MSIFQDFEEIREKIGHEKYDMIEKYLETNYTQDNIDKYFKEMNTIWNLPPDKWNNAADKLKEKYGVILLDDVLHKPDEWAKYEDWYNKYCLHRDIEILDTWVTDYDDMRCNAALYQDGNEIANIIASYDESDIRYSIGDKDSEMNQEFVNRAFRNLIYDDFDSYSKLPKISECSKLLQSIYESVCSSDATMCHITDEDWNDYYIDDYSETDIEILEKEIKKYGLEEVIGIGDDGYKIVGYGDLETRFNDDRELNINKENEMEL